jgi:WD40 repeat protein
VAELSADLAAYQQGFATRAENASLAQQIILLIRRNRGIFATGLSAWLIITALAAWFIIHLRASERETRRQAEIARAEAGRATTAEGAAVQEKEATRESLARAALNLAEAAQREANGPEMQAALNEVPADLRDSTWDYLYEQSDTSIARLQVINGVAADPTRPGVFALAGPNHGISIMDVRTGATSLEFTAGLKKASGTLRIGFSADGERIAVATAGTAGGIVIHSARDGRKLMEWDAPPVDAICFSPDGKLLQTEGVGANQIHVWDAVEGKLAWSWPPEPGGAVHGAFTPDGQRVVTVDSKESFRLVNARDGTLLRALPPIRATIRTLVMNPDGSVTAAGDHGVVVRFASGDGHVLTDFRTGGSRVDHLGVTPDGERIVTVAVLPDGRQEIRLWATGTGLAVQALLGGSGEIKKIAVHPLSGELVVGGTNARAWSLVGTPAKWTLPGVTGTRAAFLGADDVIFAHSGLVKLQAAGASTEHKLPGQYRRAAISADGHRAAIMIRAMNPILLLRDPGTAAEQIAAFQPKNDLISVSLNPAGARLAAIERTNATIEWWDTASGQRGADLEREDIKRIQDARWLDGERLLALVTARQERGNPGSEEQVIVWDTTTGKILRTVTNRTVMNALALAPDGRRFAEAGADRKVRIRDTATLAVLQEFRAHDGPIVALAWHPSRPILASASTDLSIRIWNLETGRRLEELRGPLDEPNALSFSPGGRRLACSAQDGVTHIWEPNSLQEQPAAPPKAGDWEDLLAPLTPEFVAQTGHGWRMDNGAVFSPDNRAATLPLPGNYAGASYQVRIGLRRIDPKNVLQIILPVGGRAVGFALDGYASSFTGLSRVHNAEVKDLPGAVQGPQVTDAERHELELTVRIDAASAKITARLDGRPLYEWAGPIAELSVNDRWPAPPPGALALGAAAADWVVYEVQAKRLAP